MATCTEQNDHPGDKGHLVNAPPRKAKAQKTVKFSNNSEMEESCEVCGGSFKNRRGVKIHQGKTKCKSVLENRNSKSIKGGSQDQHHSGTTYTQVPNRQTHLLSEASDGVRRDSRSGTARPLNSSASSKKTESIQKRQGVNKGEKIKLYSMDIRDYGKQNNKKAKIPTGYSENQSQLGEQGSNKDNLDSTGPHEDNNIKDSFKKLISDINTGPSGDILSRHNIPMSRGDFRSLSGKSWLNDNIINEYFNLIKERNERENLAKVFTLDTYAFVRLEENFEDAYETITQRWINKDLTEMDLVLVPIHKIDHWTLLIVCVKERKIEYYDSMIGTRNNSSAPRVFKRFFKRYFEEKNKGAEFEVIIKKDAPLQTNGYDCGVYTCLNAEKIARGGYARKQYDNTARRKMMIEIFKGTLLRRDPTDIKDILDKTKYHSGTKTKAEKINQKYFKTKSQKDTKEKFKGKRENVEDKGKGKKAPINWPKSNSKEWEKLDEDLTTLLRIMYSTPERKATSHPKIIYEMCKERFGVKEKKLKSSGSGPSKRQLKCAKLRREIKQLKTAYKEAPDSDKPGIQELNSVKLRQLRLAKRAESLRNQRKKFASNCKEFLSQPYKFSREVIAPKPKGKLESSKEEVEEHLKKAHSSKQGPSEKRPLDDLHQFNDPEYKFDDNVPTFKEFMLKLRKTRSKSAPGPNGVSYIVYKRCPGVAKELWVYLKDLWKRNTISDSWREAEGVFIPKEEGAKTVDKFRTISLLNVEGKLFFSLKADRITSFLLKNSFIDPSIQKGGIPGVSGCLEHTSILSQLIREAKKEKKNLVVTWLDIANAYGSIPHNVIKQALESAHIPIRTRELIMNYYKDLKIRFTTNDFITEWQKVEKGIITGCTLSVILFSLTMSWLVESVKRETKGPKTSSGQRQVNSRLFMDDIQTTTETVPQTKHLLGKLNEKMKWAGLDFRLVKCRYLVIYKGEVKNVEIKIDGVAMRPLKDLPVKNLGKKYSYDLGEKQQIKEVEEHLKEDLKKIGKCKLPGRYKCWMVQHMLTPRVMWPLTIYNIPMSKVEEMQKRVTKSLKSWLKVPSSLSSTCFYSTTSRLRLPFSSLVEEFKVAKARNLITFEESEDICIRNANISVDGGRKANTPGEVNQAKTRLKMQEIIGIPNKGREGLGMRGRQYYSKSSKKGKRDLVVQEIRNKEEEGRKSIMTGFSNQGAQLRWEVPQKYLKQNEIIKMPEARLSFLLKSVFDLLPTPSNKNKWFKSEEKCELCGEEGTLNHILSCCKVALTQGRYKWRHDKVLRKIAECIEKRIRVNRNSNIDITSGIQFIKEGEKRDKGAGKTKRGNYLTAAKDWEISADLDNRLTVPKEITVTNLRPDIIIYSKKTKQFGIIELTVPSEERIEVSGELKKLKYEKIAQEARSNGWGVRVWAVEVGCRGFPAASLATFLKEIGYQGLQKRKILEEIGKEAENASHSLWKASYFKDWGKK